MYVYCQGDVTTCQDPGPSARRRKIFEKVFVQKRNVLVWHFCVLMYVCTQVVADINVAGIE